MEEMMRERGETMAVESNKTVTVKVEDSPRLDMNLGRLLPRGWVYRMSGLLPIDGVFVPHEYEEAYLAHLAMQQIKELRLQLHLALKELRLIRKYGQERGTKPATLTFNAEAHPDDIAEAAKEIADARRECDEIALMSSRTARPVYLSIRELHKVVDRLYSTTGCRVYVLRECNLQARITVCEVSDMASAPESKYRYWKVGHGWVANLEQAQCIDTFELFEIPHVVMKGMATADELDAAKTQQYFTRDESRNVLKRGAE